MKMPTTRRGRYIFYRQRARRRRRRLETKLSRPGAHARRQAARMLDARSAPMQVEKLHGLKYVISPRPPFFWLVAGRVKPDRGVWGVVPNLFPPFGSWGPNTHFREPTTFYAFRRVHHLPRLKHLPRLPYPFPISALDPFQFYPYPVYPSGHLNPRAWLP